MANLCFTEIIIEGPKEQIEAFEHHLRIAREIDSDRCGKKWVGNLWLYRGYKENDIAQGKYGSCAGTIEDIQRIKTSSDDKSALFIEVSFRWEPQLKAFKEFADLYAPDCKISFEGVDPMTDFYVVSANASDRLKEETKEMYPWLSRTAPGNVTVEEFCV